MEKGKATKTINPDGTIGVYFKANEVDYQRFQDKCKLNGLKYQFELNKLIKKFNK